MRVLSWFFLGLLPLLPLGWFLFANPPARPQDGTRQIPNSELIAEAEADNIRAARLHDRLAVARLHTGQGGVHAHLPVPPDTLVKTLLDHGAMVTSQPPPIDNSPPLEYLLSWLPYIAWLFFFRHVGIRIIADRSAQTRFAALEARIIELERTHRPAPEPAGARP